MQPGHLKVTPAMLMTQVFMNESLATYVRQDLNKRSMIYMINTHELGIS